MCFTGQWFSPVWLSEKPQICPRVEVQTQHHCNVLCTFSRTVGASRTMDCSKAFHAQERSNYFQMFHQRRKQLDVCAPIFPAFSVLFPSSAIQHLSSLCHARVSVACLALVPISLSLRVFFLHSFSPPGPETPVKITLVSVN